MGHHLNHVDKNKKQLPIVYPIVFLTDNKSNLSSINIFDLFPDKELAKDILWNPYKLVNISKIPDEQLSKFLHYGILARTMKYIWEDDFLPILEKIVSDLKKLKLTGEEHYLYTVLSYIVNASRISNVN